VNPLAVVFALGCACLWGAGDFAGGLAAKRSPAWAVVVGSQTVGLLLVLILAFASAEPLPSIETLAWGVGAGLAGAAGVTALYAALASGDMGIVAPISGVGAAAIPIVFGLFVGERPTALQSIGIVAGLAAVTLASGAAKRGPSRSIGLALVAAAGFGALYIMFKQAGAGGVYWPLLAARVGSVVVLSTWCLATGRSVLPRSTRTAALVVAAGLLDVSANCLYVLSTQRGLLALVVVLASLYPVMTALLARIVLSERLARSQQVCAALAIGGALLIASG
jgi:drug/metabolite transporter (DMT)-like permease